MRDAIARVILAAALATVAALPAVAQVISIEPSAYDFGTMKQQESRTTQVMVTNQGAAQLVIDEVNADCGCTVPTLTTKVLGPGESTPIEIRFDSKKFNGNVFKTVRVHSNDPLNPVVDIILSAKVLTPLIIDPTSQRVGFTRSLQGQERTSRVTFTATEIENLEISADRTRKGLFEVKVTNDLDGNPQMAAIDVLMTGDTPPGKHRDAVRVNTNIEEMPTIDLEISAWVLQTLLTSPEQVNFRYKSAFKQDVRVSPAERDTEYKVTGAEIDLPEITVTVSETIPNKETLVRLEGSPIAPDDPRAVAANGRIKGTLTIFTDREDVPELKVSVVYMVRM